MKPTKDFSQDSVYRGRDYNEKPLDVARNVTAWANFHDEMERNSIPIGNRTLLCIYISSV
jgi:hypothetical protein